MIVFLRDIPSVDYITTLWRYLPVKYFIYLLETRSLYFRRTDLYDDFREATLPLMDEKVLHTSRDDAYWKRERKRHFVSCWIQEKEEKQEMWDKFSQKGVAIRTTAGAIIQSMVNDNEHSVIMSPVKYIDFERESTQNHETPINIIKIPLTKHQAYKTENEVRLLYSVYDAPEGEEQESYSLPIDVTKLIKKLYLHSSISQNDENVVRSTLSNLNIDIQVVKSEL